MIPYHQRLIETAQEKNSIICMGLDPVIERMPTAVCAGGTPRERIVAFFTELLDAVHDSISAVKPNFAFYEQYGIEGMHALLDVIRHAKQLGLIVIGDAKRGDIGATSAAYAKAIYNQFECDAATIAPYMGSDSVAPFIDCCKQGKGQYILCRTSNPGAKDLQDKESDGSPLYMAAAQKIIEWAKPGTGAVVGATYPEELERISRLFVESGKEIPLLIPGVGAQGGSIHDVISALKKTGNNLALHRINSSSGISYAYEKREKKGVGEDHGWVAAAVREVERMKREIGQIKP
ncbi:orotidine-5'-phosphate decarboxylase [Candidatus Woesearchaeota archaeon]|nr:orotidine-5'-phosphate decarboxylase [Candidatus Woesearchaeota archaeon]